MLNIIGKIRKEEGKGRQGREEGRRKGKEEGKGGEGRKGKRRGESDRIVEGKEKEGVGGRKDEEKRGREGQTKTVGGKSICCPGKSQMST